MTRRPPKPAPGIDPSLRPFISALARLLADDEARLAEARRALRQVVDGDVKRSRERVK